METKTQKKPKRVGFSETDKIRMVTVN